MANDNAAKIAKLQKRIKTGGMSMKRGNMKRNLEKRIAKLQSAGKSTSTVKGGQGGNKSKYSTGVDQSKRKELLVQQEKTRESVKTRTQARNRRRGTGV